MNYSEYKLYSEWCAASDDKKENDRRALLMYHKIQKAIGKKEHELSKQPPSYSIIHFGTIEAKIEVTFRQ